MGTEKPSSAPEHVPDSHVSKTVDDARKIVGSFDANAPENKEWTENAIDTRVNEHLSKHEDVPLLEIYDFNADVARAQAARILGQAAKEKRDLNPQEEREVIAAQLRVTVLESLSGALDAYMDILEQYKEYKAKGARADPAEEQIVFQHLELVKAAAVQRSDIAVRLHTKQGDRKIVEQEALAADNRMLQLLAAEDPSVPGANPQGILPAYTLILSMQNNEYNDTLNRYKQSINKDFSKVRERSEKANILLRQAFPQKREGQITKEEAEPILRTVERDYNLQQYHDDQLVLQRTKSTYEVLKARGRANVEQLARLNDSMGQYQIHRAELSSIRHHFDQGYGLKGKELPFPGQTSDAAMKASRDFLENQQKGSVGALERHLELVDKGVLRVGVKEKTETLWNERGRVFMTRIADKVATLETAWMPNVPLLKEDFLQNSTKEYLMSGLYDAVGWPRDNEGNPKEWKDLTPSEKTEIQQKQDSIEKSIDRFRETGSLQRVQTSVKAAKTLIARKDLHAQNFSEPGEIDEKTLPPETVTDTNIDELVKKHGAPMVYKMCFTQLRNNWGEYSDNYKTLLTDFHETIGAHYDFSRMMKEFANKQMGIAELLAGLGLAGWFVVAVLGLTAGQILRFSLKHGGRFGWNMTKGALRQTVRGGRGAVKMAVKQGRNFVEAVREGAKTARMVEAAGETFKNFDDLKDAIKIAKDQKNNKLLLKLLQHPLLREAAKSGNVEAKALFRVARFLTVGKWAVRSLPFIATLVDAALLGMNEVDIANAKKEKNAGMQQTLESKRTVLAGQAGVGLAMFAMSGPQIIAVAPVALATSIYTNQIYNSIIDWEKSSNDWKKQSPEELRDALDAIPYGHTNIGHRTGLGDSILYRGWKNLAWSSKEIQEEDDRKMASVESINRHVRQEILTAYFLNTMTVGRMQSETDDQFKNRVTDLIRDRLNVMRRLSDGTFVVGNLGQSFFDMAGNYADLAALKRTLPQQKTPYTYEWNGTSKQLDLSALEYINGSGNDDKGQKKFFETMRQYQEEVMPQFEAIRALRALPEEDEK